VLFVGLRVGEIDEANMRCAGISKICMPNPSIVAFIVSKMITFIRTDGHG